MPPRFGTDGIRGVAGLELTAEVALALGRATARLVGGSSFLLGRDTRRSGPMLQAAMAAGLASEGMDVVDAGVIPTPGVAWLAASRGVGAAMISASHNPFTDNGIKLFDATGTKLPSELEAAVQAELGRLLAPTATHEAAGLVGVDELGASIYGGQSGTGIGSIAVDDVALEKYAAHLVATVGRSSAPGFEVVVDCANGAASVLAPLVLGRLGISHRVLAAEPDGENINAGCGSTHLEPLQAEVVAAGAGLGIALDGDADRMLAVDHTGAVVDGDQLIAMFALDLAARGRLTNQAVAVTVMSNLGLRRSLGARGIRVIETPVGDRNVTDAIAANDLALGGEQSGHFVFREHGTTGDGLLTALLLCDLLGRQGRPLAELAAASMTSLPQVLRNVTVADPSRLGVAAGVWEEVGAVEAELGEDGRVLLRASGTEPLVRVMVEAATLSVAIEAAERLIGVVEREFGATAAPGRS